VEGGEAFGKDLEEGLKVVGGNGRGLGVAGGEREEAEEERGYWEGGEGGLRAQVS
jgi:hypothetical protein